MRFGRAAIALTLSTALLCLTAQPRAAEAPQSKALPADLEATFDAVYNLDFTDALAKAREIISKRPDDPAAYRAVATVVWLQILFARGGTFVDHYLGKVSKTEFNVPKPPPELDAEFNRVVDKAIALSEARVKANPKDAAAQFDLGAAWALRSGYAGSVQGSVTGAFAAARHAYNAHEEVLDLDPNFVEANLVVGMYRYAVSTFGLPTRMFAYLAGFGGGKERGIQMIEAAAKGGIEQNDAIFALAVVYSREGRHDEAAAKMRELQKRLPRNRLMVLEEGAALIRAGHAEQAEAVLTGGLAKLEKDTRQLTLGERAYWLYKRGFARINANKRTDAQADLDAALGANPVGWVRGRIFVARGHLSDLAGKRDEAVGNYRMGADLCAKNNDPLCVAGAGRYIKNPFILR